jgi:hypothetical protein
LIHSPNPGFTCQFRIANTLLTVTVNRPSLWVGKLKCRLLIGLKMSGIGKGANH